MNNSLTLHKSGLPGLIQIDKSVIETLPIGMQKFVLAKESEVLSELSPLDRECFVVDLIAETLLNIGHTLKASDGMSIEQIAISVSSFIFETHKDMTKAELKLAFLSYFINQDGQDIGVNLKSAAGAIRAYKNNESKKLAMAEYNRLLDLIKIKTELTPEEKKAIIVDYCLKFFDEYKTKTLIRLFIMPIDKQCRIFFDLLVERKILILTKEQQDFYREKAEKDYVEHLNNSKKNRQITKSNYEMMLGLVTSGENISVKNIRGKLALLDFFDKLIEQKIELQSILSNLKQ